MLVYPLKLRNIEFNRCNGSFRTKFTIQMRYVLKMNQKTIINENTVIDFKSKAYVQTWIINVHNIF